MSISRFNKLYSAGRSQRLLPYVLVAFALVLSAGLAVAKDERSRETGDSKQQASTSDRAPPYSSEDEAWREFHKQETPASKAAEEYLRERGGSVVAFFLDDMSVGLPNFHRVELGVAISDAVGGHGPRWTGRDEDLLRLAAIPNIRLVSVDHKISRPEFLAFLPKMKQLRYLTICDMACLSDDWVPYVAQCHKLEELNLVGHISNDGMARLAELSSLKELTIWSGAEPTTARGARGIAKITSLRVLCLLLSYGRGGVGPTSSS